MATETKKRYKSFDYITPKVAEKSKRLGGNMEESEFEELEVVTLTNPDGEEVRVWKSDVEDYKKVWAEMAESQEEDE
jgi:hypothetical protein